MGMPTVPEDITINRLLQPLIRVVIRGFDRYMPEPFTFAIVMTLAAMILAYGYTPTDSQGVVMAWGNGLSSLLPFITQVCLTILFAYALAHLGPVPRYLEWLAGLPKTATSAYGFVALFAGCVCLIAWPLGTILGGLMARQVALSLSAQGYSGSLPIVRWCGIQRFCGLAHGLFWLGAFDGGDAGELDGNPVRGVAAGDRNHFVDI